VTKDLDYYRRQPYERVLQIRHEGDQRYLLYRVREIPTIAGDGLTKDEALTHLRAAFDDYITWALDEGLEVPAPARGLMRSPQAAKRMVAHQVLPGASVAVVAQDTPTSGPETQQLRAAAIA